MHCPEAPRKTPAHSFSVTQISGVWNRLPTGRKPVPHLRNRLDRDLSAALRAAPFRRPVDGRCRAVSSVFRGEVDSRGEPRYLHPNRDLISRIGVPLEESRCLHAGKSGCSGVSFS